MNLNRRSCPFIVAAAAVLSVFVPARARADTVYNNAVDFSATNNPNGVWSYGWLAPGAAPNASTFTLYTQSFTVPTGYTLSFPAPTGLEVWGANTVNPQWVFYNSSNSAQTYYGTLTLQPGEAAFHPGPDGEYSVYRFTAPTTGTYSVATEFSGLDWGGPNPSAPNYGMTSTDVHILENGTSIFYGTINGSNVPGLVSGPNPTAFFDSTLFLTAGETLDFVVGYGSNQTYYHDTTGLDATIKPLESTATPEPSSMIMLGGFAAVTAIGTAFRKKRHRVNQASRQAVGV